MSIHNLVNPAFTELFEDGSKPVISEFKDELKRVVGKVTSLSKTIRVNIQFTATHNGELLPMQFLGVPVFLINAFTHIFKQSSKYQAEGIFRLDGNQRNLKDVSVNIFVGNERMAQSTSLRDSCTMVKRFLRDLNPHLISDNLIEHLYPATSTSGSCTVELALNVHLASNAAKLQQRTSELGTLLFILWQLNKIAQKSAFNKMTDENLVTVFAPCLTMIEPKVKPKKKETSNPNILINRNRRVLLTLMERCEDLASYSSVVNSRYTATNIASRKKDGMLDKVIHVCRSFSTDRGAKIPLHYRQELRGSLPGPSPRRRSTSHIMQPHDESQKSDVTPTMARRLTSPASGAHTSRKESFETKHSIKNSDTSYNENPISLLGEEVFGPRANREYNIRRRHTAPVKCPVLKRNQPNSISSGLNPKQRRGHSIDRNSDENKENAEHDLSDESTLVESSSDTLTHEANRVPFLTVDHSVSVLSSVELGFVEHQPRENIVVTPLQHERSLEHRRRREDLLKKDERKRSNERQIAAEADLPAQPNDTTLLNSTKIYSPSVLEHDVLSSNFAELRVAPPPAETPPRPNEYQTTFAIPLLPKPKLPPRPDRLSLAASKNKSMSSFIAPRTIAPVVKRRIVRETSSSAAHRQATLFDDSFSMSETLDEKFRRIEALHTSEGTNRPSVYDLRNNREGLVRQRVTMFEATADHEVAPSRRPSTGSIFSSIPSASNKSPPREQRSSGNRNWSDTS